MRLLSRSILTFAFLSLPLLAQAQVSESQLEALLQGANEMQACFARLDQSKLEAMGNRAEALGKELEAMCASGDRDGAQTKAIAYGREIAASEEMQVLKECGQMAQAMVPHLTSQLEAMDSDDADAAHVCDNL